MRSEAAPKMSSNFPLAERHPFKPNQSLPFPSFASPDLLRQLMHNVGLCREAASANFLFTQINIMHQLTEQMTQYEAEEWRPLDKTASMHRE